MTIMRTCCQGPAVASLAVVLFVASAWAPAAAAQDSDRAPRVTITRLAGGRALIETSDGGTSVRKEVSAEASHVTIATAHDELQLRVVRGQLTASTPEGTVSVSAADPKDMGRLVVLLQRSDAAARGRALLTRVAVDPRDSGQQMLLLTRAILELAQGPSAALLKYRHWMDQEERRLGARPAVVKASTSEQGPGDCWDLYSKEALRIAEDFSGCTSGLSWYDGLGWSGCSLIYAIRAEAAMFWFISCNGGIPFKA